MTAQHNAEYQRALARANQVLEQRGGTDSVEQAAVPGWLATRYLGLHRLSWVLMLLVAVAVAVANDGRWYFHVLAAVVVLLAGSVRFSQWIEVASRRQEAARIRRYSPDEFDTLTERRKELPVSFLTWRTVLSITVEVVLLISLLLWEAVLVWEDGALPRVASVLAVVAAVIAQVLLRFSARRALRWRADFLREEGKELPPLPPDWEVLLLR